jgi:sensor histidine kinase regulating citrate/malate metabolism
MIATQLYLESSRDKLHNIIVNKSLDGDIKNLRAPEQIGQVINQLTHDAVMRSQNGGQLNIRLYTQQNDIVFEVEDAPPSPKKNGTSNISHTIKYSFDELLQSQPLNQLLCQKIINKYEGSIGIRHEKTGDVHFFKIPKKQFILGGDEH